LPTVLVTTPESMSLLLSYLDALERFEALKCVIVDEWHELMSSKRGVQTELALARLRRVQPGLRTWGLSATMKNLQEAAATLAGPVGAKSMRIVRAPDEKPIVLDSLLPATVERFPWAGHLGMRMVEDVARKIEQGGGSSLVFTHTRSQSEIWFRALLGARPD